MFIWEIHESPHNLLSYSYSYFVFIFSSYTIKICTSFHMWYDVVERKHSKWFANIALVNFLNLRVAGWNKFEGMADIVEVRAQDLARTPGVHGQEGRQDIRHGDEQPQCHYHDSQHKRQLRFGFEAGSENIVRRRYSGPHLFSLLCERDGTV